ncbi:MAG: hypothetical protein MI862_12900 [Desulfobacterales bacterium]|nr:hypothetical protein [Desulfobacterales bacterium]
MKRIILIIAAFVLICVIYYAARIFASYQKGYQSEEMDWNQDGRTSIAEIIKSSDVGSRPQIVGDVECVEYFFYKDGLPIKVVCPEKK